MAALDATSCSALLETSRYDPAILPRLEAYCAGPSYDLDANLATLKLYQFHPETLKVPVLAKILAKALMRLPQTDYLCCTYLVSDAVAQEAPISTIATAAGLLETCSFREFWAAAEPLRADVLAGVPGFDAAVREFMLGNVEITYQSVPLAHLKASLGLGDAELAKLVGAKGWTVAGDTVKISLNADNQAKPKKADVSETMNMTQMTKILTSVASS